MSKKLETNTSTNPYLDNQILVNKNDAEQSISKYTNYKNTQLPKFDYSKLSDTSVYIVAANRTPIGKYGGSLMNITAPELGAHCIKNAINKTKISKNKISELIFGNVLQSNVGQNPARQACLLSNLPSNIPCTTINKVCSSGMKSIMFGFNSIKLGYNNIVICGGMESMSNVPYYLLQHRFGVKMGHQKIVDGMIKDGLWDPFSDSHMGDCAEKCAKKHKITRKEQDDWAIRSYKKAQQCNENGTFDNEIIPISVPQRKAKDIIISNDEGCKRLNEEKLRSLKGAFDKNGTVTAGNASQLSDGAACIVICSGKYLKERYKQSQKTDESKQDESNNITPLKPLCEILSTADAAQEPVDFPTTPSIAIPIALKRAGLKLKDLTNNDYFEINEAFSVAAIANMKLLNLKENNINIYGGAIAMGHPLGCSGARIIVTLITALKNNNGRYGIAGICNGGGGASAIVIKNIQ